MERSQPGLPERLPAQFAKAKDSKISHHDAICERAKRWLRGTMRCNPVFSNCASCAEIPDAIGWTSIYQFYGSIVVECKTSHSDFLADKYKAFCYRHPDIKYNYRTRSRRMTKAQAAEEGYIAEAIPRMGTRRYFMCLGPHIISPQDIQKHFPDHGLLYWEGRRIRVMIEAPLRVTPDLASEIHFLRFAIINQKSST